MPAQTETMEMSFKQRVNVFWNWFGEHAEALSELVSSQQHQQAFELISPQVESLGPGFGWNFGPGESSGQSLTLSPNGLVGHQLLANYWLARAPKFSGWTFYSSKQRSANGEAFALQVGDQRIETKDIQIEFTPDDEAENIDIVAYHPSFAQLSEQDQFQIVFLMLDESLGEHGTSAMVGEIEMSTSPLERPVSLSQFYDSAMSVFEQREWTLGTPGESYTLISIGEAIDGEFVRSDAITINSCFPDLVIEFLSQDGKLDDPIIENGGAFIFVDIPRSYFPVGDEAHSRGEFEDDLNDRLVANQAGELIGGSAGSISMYSDFILFDCEEGLELVRQFMVEKELPEGSAIHFFGNGKPSVVI